MTAKEDKPIHLNFFLHRFTKLNIDSSSNSGIPITAVLVNLVINPGMRAVKKGSNLFLKYFTPLDLANVASYKTLKFCLKLVKKQ